MTVVCVLFGIVFALIDLGCLWVVCCVWYEHRTWNQGICRSCGHDWVRLSDDDGRYYSCGCPSARQQRFEWSVQDAPGGQ